MANYVAATGGRTRAEMQNTTKLAEASAAYMFELDALATIHGKNRQQMEEEGKKAAANAAYQRKLATLSEEERTKLEIARKQAIASGIAGAEDLVMSTALGLPPMTKAAQMLSGYAPGVAAGLNSMTKTALDQTKTVKDLNQENAKFRIAIKETANNFTTTGDAIVMQGGEAGNLINSIISEQNKLNSQGINVAVTEEDKEDENNPWSICTAQLGKKFKTTKRSEWSPKQVAKYERCVRDVKKSLKEGKNPVTLFFENKIMELLETHLPPKISKKDLIQFVIESEPVTKPGTKNPPKPGTKTPPKPTKTPVHPGKNPNPETNPSPKAKGISPEEAKEKIIDTIIKMLKK